MVDVVLEFNSLVDLCRDFTHAFKFSGLPVSSKCLRQSLVAIITLKRQQLEFEPTGFVWQSKGHTTMHQTISRLFVKLPPNSVTQNLNLSVINKILKVFLLVRCGLNALVVEVQVCEVLRFLRLCIMLYNVQCSMHV